MRVVAPKTLDEALELKARLGPDARVLAGGQSLAVLLQKGLVMPEMLIYLGEIKELTTLSVDAASVRLGAMVTMSEVEQSPELRRVAPILPSVCGVVASPHVRNMGTVVGNLCHAEVGSDPPQALLALDAELHACSTRGDRWIPVHDFVQGFFETRLEDHEIATEVRFSLPSGTATYLKHRVRQMDLAVVGVAIALSEEDGAIARARIAVGGIGPRPLRATKAEAQLEGMATEEAERCASDIGAAAADEVSPSLSDVFGSAAYRKTLVTVGVRRGLLKLLSPKERT